MSTRACRWPMFKQVICRQQLMDCMMEARGVDVLAAVRADRGQAFLEARSRCRGCVHECECREWLASIRQMQQQPSFCPNFEFFSLCHATDPEPAPHPSAGGK